MGQAPYPPGQFLETSPTMNLLLYPEPLHYNRRHLLDPALFQYLEGCVRQDDPYTIPEFAEHADKPLLYISSGSMNEGDVDLIERQTEVIGKLPYRALINVGNNLDAYPSVPGNIHLAPWFPQPSVIPQADIVIHHGGNNTFTESLYFGKPALIMPFSWEGHDNAQRIEDKGYGAQLPRYDWSDEEFAATLDRLMTDEAMHARLATTSAHMQKQHGHAKAADILIGILAKG